MLSSLESKLEKDIKAQLSFEDGQVAVKPFEIKYEDIPIEVSGTHSLSNAMDYKAVFKVPAKYLGSDVNRIIGKIGDPEVDKITIPVTANIGGTFAKPDIKTDLASGIKNLTNQLIEIQKQKLIDKGTDKVDDLLGGLLGGKKSTATDSTNTTTDSTKSTKGDKLKNGLKNRIGDLFKKSKKEADSTNN